MAKKIKWSIDPTCSLISFKVRHLLITHVEGNFKTFDASIYTSGKNFKTADIDLWMDVSSISTGDEKRDVILKSADFFDVDNHKQITFTSNTMGKSLPDGNHELWGDLTIKGVTRKLKLNVQFEGILKDEFGKEKAGFTITGIIKRSVWKLIWTESIETEGILMSDEITILCDVELLNVSQSELPLKVVPEENKPGIL